MLIAHLVIVKRLYEHEISSHATPNQIIAYRLSSYSIPNILGSTAEPCLNTLCMSRCLTFGCLSERRIIEAESQGSTSMLFVYPIQIVSSRNRLVWSWRCVVSERDVYRGGVGWPLQPICLDRRRQPRIRSFVEPT